MKILWLSHLIPYPPKGGALQRSYNLIKELSRYHEVHLLAFNQKELMASLFESPEEGIAEAHKSLSILCKRVQFFSIPSVNHFGMHYLLAVKSLIHEPYNINWLKSTEYSNVIKKWVKQEKYDLVHFDTISLVPFFDAVPASIPTVLDHHNIESHMLIRRAKNEKNILKKMYFWQEGKRLSRYERSFCPRFSLNITCSDIDSVRLNKEVPTAEVVTIPNGVDLKFFNPHNLRTESDRLIFIGSMTWYPNIEAVKYIAEKIWLPLKKKHPNLSCDIIGANPPRELKSIGDKLPDFNIHGFVDDIRDYLAAASVYICPIRDGGGTKLKVLDAMAMAKAIVAHPVACEGIDVTHAENVLLAEREDLFVEYVDLLLTNKKKREKLGEAARKLVEQLYSYKSIGQKLAKSFQNCIGDANT